MCFIFARQLQCPKLRCSRNSAYYLLNRTQPKQSSPPWLRCFYFGIHAEICCCLSRVPRTSKLLPQKLPCKNKAHYARSTFFEHYLPQLSLTTHKLYIIYSAALLAAGTEKSLLHYSLLYTAILPAGRKSTAGAQI